MPSLCRFLRDGKRCDRPVTHTFVLQTPSMSGPGFYVGCGECCRAAARDAESKPTRPIRCGVRSLNVSATVS